MANARSRISRRAAEDAVRALLRWAGRNAYLFFRSGVRFAGWSKSLFVREQLTYSLPVALAGALAMGAAFSLLYPSLSLIVVSSVSDRRRGAALGTFTAFFDAGVGLGAPLAGAAAALTSYAGAFFLSAAIALVAAATIALTISPRGRALLATR